MSMGDLSGRKVVVVIGPGFQDQEALEPMQFLTDEGAEVVTVGVDRGTIAGIHGATVAVSHTFDELDPAGFDAMLVPGGRSPAYLRKYPESLEFVRAFRATGKPLAAICHGGQLLASAGLVEGLKMTGWPGIRDEMLSFGADFQDTAVVIDGSIITSRKPEDIPDFNRALKKALLAKRAA